MKKSVNKIKTPIKLSWFRKTLKILGYTFLGIFMLFLIASIGLSIYFDNHKAEIVTKINKQINENIKGTVSIGDIGYKLFKGFPNLALTINNVELKDSLWTQHKHTLLTAKEIEVRLNLKTLLIDKQVAIEKIQINNATINIYKDKNGYSNSDIFKPKPKDTLSKKKPKTTIGEIALNQVEFISENRQRDKLFDFMVNTLDSKIEYTDTGWKTELYVNTLAKSMAFKLSKGSFITNKKLEGTLSLNFSNEENKISIVTDKLAIGDDDFAITAHFCLDKSKPLFDIDITTEILWKNATQLLNSHIAKKLNPFNLSKPIKVNCTIKGNTSVQGNPEIIVKAIIKDNELQIPDGKITDCSFEGKYTNNYKEGEDYIDENSAIIIDNFSGKYNTIPFSIPEGMIHNLSLPSASGTFKAAFEAVKLNSLINDDFMSFSGGDVNVSLKFNANIVSLKINKPLFSGNVSLAGASFNYVPKALTFEKTAIQLNFTENQLIIDKINYTNKKNTVLMKGKIDNFLNLYYNSPEKMVVNWDIYTPSFDIQQLINVLAKNKKTTVIKKPKKKVVSSKMQSILDKCQVIITIKADKMSYKKLLANSVAFKIQLINDQLFVKNGLIKTCNGMMTFDAQLIPKNNLYHFSANTSIKTVAIPQFLTAFNNFGIKSFQPEDIKGNLTVIASLNGFVTQTGALVENSLQAKVKYNVFNGSLNNFEPIIKVGKFAFPNRNVKNIDFNELDGKLAINGEMVSVDFFKVSSSVLNMDVKGIYSFGKGTNLHMTIPMRNPKDDYKITDIKQREALRYKGIVLHLLAVDDSDGKIKIKLDPQ